MPLEVRLGSAEDQRLVLFSEGECQLYHRLPSKSVASYRSYKFSSTSTLA